MGGLKFHFLICFVFLAANAHSADKILMIGDSHMVMDFGNALTRDLAPTAKRYAVGGVAANDWLLETICPQAENCPFTYGYALPAGVFEGPLPESFPGIQRALKITGANLVVVALGTNDASQRCGMPSPSDMQPFVDLTERIGRRKCIWVGPPSYNKGPVLESCGGHYNEFVMKLKKTVQARGCDFIDSRLIVDHKTHRPIESDNDDEIHFGTRLGRLWGETVARKIRGIWNQNESPHRQESPLLPPSDVMIFPNHEV